MQVKVHSLLTMPSTVLHTYNSTLCIATGILYSWYTLTTMLYTVYTTILYCTQCILLDLYTAKSILYIMYIAIPVSESIKLKFTVYFGYGTKC